MRRSNVFVSCPAPQMVVNTTGQTAARAIMDLSLWTIYIEKRERQALFILISLYIYIRSRERERERVNGGHLSVTWSHYSKTRLIDSRPPVRNRSHKHGPSDTIRLLHFRVETGRTDGRTDGAIEMKTCWRKSKDESLCMRDCS
jgi:hypothetical protein